MLLTLLIMVLDVLKPHGAAAPSFDCTQTISTVQRMVCDDVALAGLDREMADRFAAALSASPADTDARKRQRLWLASRDDCGGTPEQRACVAAAYQRRILELKIESGEVPVFAAATYACEGHTATPATASYYQSAPPAVLIEYQDVKVVAFLADSASGARYTTDGVELWEHQGTASLKWFGTQLKCARK